MKVVFILWAPLAVASCALNTPSDLLQTALPSSQRESTVLLPESGKVLLIIGQDLASINSYRDSGYFPEPGGIAGYLAFYSLVQSSFPAYGALGQYPDGSAYNNNVDWGSGPLNAYQMALDFPDSALVLGLNIAEGSGDNVWAPGGLADIGVGAYDENIRRLARFCKELDRAVYLRIGYEFDGVWNRGYARSSSYIDAYRRIVNIMREQSVSKVAFVWQASASPIDDIIEGRRENIEDWYPGDDYVDWMGLSWFLPADQRRGDAPTQRELADEVLDFARLKNKPVMISEAAPQGYDLEKLTRANISPLWDGKAGQNIESKLPRQIWQEWFEPLLDYIHSNVDVIRALVYINADWGSQAMWARPYQQGYWGDSRLQMNSEIRHYWLSEIRNTDFWQHGADRAFPDTAEN